MEFGEKLSSARKAKGFSQEGLAAKIDVSRQAVSKWENGTAQPETANILKLCEVLEISPNELFGYEEKFSVSAGPKKQKSEKSGKIFLVIIAAVILFSAFLIWVDETRGTNRYYDKTLPIPITNLDIHVPGEQPDEGFLSVELVATFKTVKSFQTFGFTVSGIDSEGKTFTEDFSATKNGPKYNSCSALIKVPVGGEFDLIITSKEWSRSSSKNIGKIYNITEKGISFESYPDNELY